MAFLNFLGPFGVIFWPVGLFLGSRSDSKIFLEPTNVDYHFLFWKYSTIFLFFIGPNFGPFSTFWALWGYFWGGGQVQKLFWDLLTLTNNWLENLILMKTQSSAYTWTWTLNFDLRFVKRELCKTLCLQIEVKFLVPLKQAIKLQLRIKPF